MSNKKISELELVASNASGDQFVLVQNGETMRTTMSKIYDYLASAFNVSNYYTKPQADVLLATKQDKQSLEQIEINAQEISALSVDNCILAISNFASGSGNATITIDCTDALSSVDTLSLQVIYRGYDVNLRSYFIREVGDSVQLELFLNLHSNPDEPVLISLQKTN
jgi:hypothetical protein